MDIRNLLFIVIVGFCIWFVDKYVPMWEPLNIVLKVIGVLFIVLQLLAMFGIADVPLPRFR